MKTNNERVLWEVASIKVFEKFYFSCKKEKKNVKNKLYFLSYLSLKSHEIVKEWTCIVGYNQTRMKIIHKQMNGENAIFSWHKVKKKRK